MWSGPGQESITQSWSGCCVTPESWENRDRAFLLFLASSSTCSIDDGGGATHLWEWYFSSLYRPLQVLLVILTFYKRKSAGPMGGVIFIAFCRKWNTVVFLISLRNIYFLKMLYFMFSENIKCKSSLETRRKSLGYLWIEENFCNFLKIYLKRVNVGFFKAIRKYFENNK